MRSIFTLGAVLCCLALPSARPHAQHTSRFDAVVVFGTITLNDFYSEGAFRRPPTIVRTFGDSIRAGAMPVGFTMKDVDTSGSGWHLWYDFNREFNGRQALIRVTAQKRIDMKEAKPFADYLEWIEKVLGGKLGPREMTGEMQARWPWKPAPGYFLHAAQLLGDDQQFYRLLSLRR
jgi:hypothetical protein